MDGVGTSCDHSAPADIAAGSYDDYSRERGGDGKALLGASDSVAIGRQMITLKNAAYIGGKLCPIGFQLIVENDVIVDIPQEQPNRGGEDWSGFYPNWIGQKLSVKSTIFPIYK